MYSRIDPPEADAFPELEQNRMFSVKAPVDENFRPNPDKRDFFQYPLEGWKSAENNFQLTKRSLA